MAWAVDLQPPRVPPACLRLHLAAALPCSNPCLSVCLSCLPAAEVADTRAMKPPRPGRNQGLLPLCGALHHPPKLGCASLAAHSRITPDPSK